MMVIFDELRNDSSRLYYVLSWTLRKEKERLWIDVNG